MVAALRGVLAVMAQLGQLLIEGLDGGFLLAKDFLYQLVAMGFERLLLGEEFIDRIVGHVDYDAITAAIRGARDTKQTGRRESGSTRRALFLLRREFVLHHFDDHALDLDLRQINLTVMGQALQCAQLDIQPLKSCRERLAVLLA